MYHKTITIRFDERAFWHEVTIFLDLLNDKILALKTMYMHFKKLIKQLSIYA